MPRISKQVMCQVTSVSPQLSNHSGTDMLRESFTICLWSNIPYVPGVMAGERTVNYPTTLLAGKHPRSPGGFQILKYREGGGPVWGSAAIMALQVPSTLIIPQFRKDRSFHYCYFFLFFKSHLMFCRIFLKYRFSVYTF